jgi:hypothetical protein
MTITDLSPETTVQIEADRVKSIIDQAVEFGLELTDIEAIALDALIYHVKPVHIKPEHLRPRIEDKRCDIFLAIDRSAHGRLVNERDMLLNSLFQTLRGPILDD